jgi:LuxR family maltose regulon positive regulatory protein
MLIQNRLEFNRQLRHRRLALHIDLDVPPGYSALAALAAGLSMDGYRVAWLDLNEQDDTPETFIAHLTSALADGSPELFNAPEPASSALIEPDWQDAAIVLLNLLVDLPVDLVVILFNYQAIHNPTVHQVVQLLLDHLPPQAHLLISSSTSLPLDIARWRVRGEVLEIDPQLIS